MKTFIITGSAGFLGSQVVEQVLNEECEVKAIIRPGCDINHLLWKNNSKVEFIEVNLADDTSVELISEIIIKINRDKVVMVHTAASFAGDDKYHAEHTVNPTENIFKAMMKTGLRRIVLISSLSVYGYSSLPDNTQLDECTPTETFEQYRDAYCRAKLAQEEIAMNAAQCNGFLVSILRPGVIYGSGRLWTSRLGIANGFMQINIGKRGLLPLISVEDCAKAVILASQRDNFMSDVYISPDKGGERGALEIINIIGDELLEQERYLQIINQYENLQKRKLTIPWVMMKQVSKYLFLMGVFFPKLFLKFPTVLLEPSLHARFKPLRYSNCRLKDRLAWKAQSSLLLTLSKL